MIQKPIRLDLPTPFSVGSVNAYLFIEPEPTLIDCGMDTAGNRDAITAGLAEYGLQPQDLQKVIITHAHVDHAGGAKWLTEASRAEVWVSDLVYPWVANLTETWAGRVNFIAEILQLGAVPAELIRHYLDYMKQVPTMWGDVPAERLVRFPIEGEMSFGGHTWQTLYAPGHTYTQSCFFNRDNGWLLSADMLLPIIPVPVIEQPPDGVTERIPGLPQYMVSLDRFADLDVSTVYPGHGSAFQEHRLVIDQQRKRVELRTEECLKLVTSGVSSAYGVAEKMYAHYPAVARMTGFSMVIGYLDLLLAQRRVVRETKDGRWHFTLHA